MAGAPPNLLKTPAPPDQTPRHQLVLPPQSVSFDVKAFDNLIRSHSVQCEVYSAMICPLEATDADDMRSHTHNECQNGFLYRKEGVVSISFTGNQTRPDFTGAGMQDASTVVATLPRFYDDDPTKPVILGQYYRIYVKDCPVFVTNTEKIEHHQSGLDKLSYPVKSVQRLIDSRGVEYVPGTDFDITPAGLLQWRSGHAPGYDPVQNKGVIYSIEYLYLPFYYVASLPHEIRVAKSVDPTTGQVNLERLHQQAALQREWMFEVEEREEAKGGSARAVRQPRSGSFGPR